MVIFRSYVKLPEGTVIIPDLLDSPIPWMQAIHKGFKTPTAQLLMASVSPYVDRNKKVYYHVADQLYPVTARNHQYDHH